MTHNWFLLSEPWYAYWKRLQVFFFPHQLPRIKLKWLEKSSSSSWHSRCWPICIERDLCQIVFGYGRSKSQLLTQEPTIPLKKHYIYYTNFILAAPFFLCTMGQSSTTTFFEHLLIYLLGHSFLINQTFRSSNNLLISMLFTKTKTPKETKPNPTHIKITKLLPLKQTAQVLCQNLIF